MRTNIFFLRHDLQPAKFLRSVIEARAVGEETAIWGTDVKEEDDLVKSVLQRGNKAVQEFILQSKQKTDGTKACAKNLNYTLVRNDARRASQKIRPIISLRSFDVPLFIFLGSKITRFSIQKLWNVSQRYLSLMIKCPCPTFVHRRIASWWSPWPGPRSARRTPRRTRSRRRRCWRTSPAGCRQGRGRRRTSWKIYFVRDENMF